MSEQKERGGESQVENKPMTEEEAIEKMKEITGIGYLEIDPIHTWHNEKGELMEIGTKTVWGDPNEDGVYYGKAYFYQSAAVKSSRRKFKEFNNIIFRVDWSGIKKGTGFEESEEEGQEVIADW